MRDVSVATETALLLLQRAIAPAPSAMAEGKLDATTVVSGWRLVLLSISTIVIAAALAAAAPDAPAASPAPAAPAPDGPFEQVGRVEGGVPRHSSPFDAGGAAFVTATKEGARVWDSATLKPLTQPLPHEHVWYARLAAGGKTLFTGGPRDVRVWDVATSKPLSVTRVARETNSDFDVSPDGSLFTAIDGAGGRTVAVWRTGEGRPDLLLRHDWLVASAAFDPAGKRIVTHEKGPGGGCFHVWSAETGERLYSIGSDDVYSTPGRARFDPEGKRLLIARWSGFIVVDAETGKPLVDVRDDQPLVNTGQIRFSGDAKRVTVAMLNWNEFEAVRVYDAATGKLQREFGTDMYDCQVCPGGRWAWCNTIGPPPSVQQVWDLTTGSKVQTIKQSGEAAMSPDGSTVLVTTQVGFNDHATTVWRLRPANK